jgi:hypothetical protein
MNAHRESEVRKKIHPDDCSFNVGDVEAPEVGASQIYVELQGDDAVGSNMGAI